MFFNYHLAQAPGSDGEIFNRVSDFRESFESHSSNMHYAGSKS